MTSSATALQVPEQPESLRGRRASIGRTFKKVKTVLQKIGGFGKEKRVSPQPEPSNRRKPIEILVVDDAAEEPFQPLPRLNKPYVLIRV
jgi:hypothetical protein